MLAVGGTKAFNSYCSFTKVSAVKSWKTEISQLLRDLLVSTMFGKVPYLVATVLLLVSIYTAAVVRTHSAAIGNSNKSASMLPIKWSCAMTDSKLGWFIYSRLFLTTSSSFSPTQNTCTHTHTHTHTHSLQSGGTCPASATINITAFNATYHLSE